MAMIAILAILLQVFETAAHISGQAASAEIAVGCAMTAADDPDERPQRGVPTDWHFHGCLSASTSTPLPTALVRLPIALSAWPSLDEFRTGLAAGVDPPPPRWAA